MTTHIELILPSDVEDPDALREAFGRIVEILDGLAGEPVEGRIYGSDDLGPNMTLHIRQAVHPFRITADEVRRGSYPGET